ncbi:hypothetical protein DSECCO2_495610 [anaerobic digester metagenome]
MPPVLVTPYSLPPDDSINVPSGSLPFATPVKSIFLVKTEPAGSNSNSTPIFALPPFEVRPYSFPFEASIIDPYGLAPLVVPAKSTFFA